MSPGRPGSERRSRRTASRDVAGRSAAGQKGKRKSEAGDRSSSCFISGSCDRKWKVLASDLSRRRIQAGWGRAELRERTAQRGVKKKENVIHHLKFVVSLCNLEF